MIACLLRMARKKGNFTFIFPCFLFAVAIGVSGCGSSTQAAYPATVDSLHLTSSETLDGYTPPGLDITITDSQSVQNIYHLMLSLPVLHLSTQYQSCPLGGGDSQYDLAFFLHGRDVVNAIVYQECVSRVLIGSADYRKTDGSATGTAFWQALEQFISSGSPSVSGGGGAG